jgi:polyphosphate kinase
MATSSDGRQGARRRIRAVAGRVPTDGAAKLKKRVRAVIDKLPTREASKLLEETLIAHYQGEELKPYQAELVKLQQHLERTGGKMMVLMDGRDASGKGGTIRRLTRYMNEKRYRVVALGKPTPRQLTELHMKRYIEQFPTAGEIVLFDRSWYNRAMVEPVMGFCSDAQYQQFMADVVGYEESFIADGKTILLKLYFSVSKEEQARRFQRRKHDALRQWKLSEVDLQAQELWDSFTEAKFRLLKQTHTPRTPWFVIRSDDKHLARLETIKLILNSLRYRGRSRALDLRLNPEVVIPGDVELRNMINQRRRHGKFLY